MKPTPAQQLVLQQYLRKVLRYRETYAEFYDHILAAVEAEKTDVLFEDLVIKIIKADFGGAKGMRLIEEKYQQSIFKELKKKYLAYAINNFKFPGIFITMAFSVLIYFVVKQPWFSLDIFLWNILAIRIMPDILNAIIHIWSPRIYGAPRQSIKSGFLKWQNFIPAFIFLIAYLLASHSNYFNPEWLREITPTPIIMTIVMLLIALHSLTYYKVFSANIKTSFSIS